MDLKIDTKITEKELFHFLMYHTYSSVWGFTGIIISICAMLAFIQLCYMHGDGLSKACMLITALLFLVVQPLRLNIQSKRMMENDRGYQEPVQYVFSQRGISISQGEDTAFYAWAEVQKVISTKKIIAIYVGKKKVFKLSCRDVADKYDDLKEIVRNYAVQAAIRMK